METTHEAIWRPWAGSPRPDWSWPPRGLAPPPEFPRLSWNSASPEALGLCYWRAAFGRAAGTATQAWGSGARAVLGSPGCCDLGIDRQARGVLGSPAIPEPALAWASVTGGLGHVLIMCILLAQLGQSIKGHEAWSKGSEAKMIHGH